MATVGGIFIPDYDGSQATGFIGSLTNTSFTGPLVVGKYRLFKVVFQPATSSANSVVLRFTMGNSVIGHTATTPVATSPFLHNYQENIFEFDGSIDSINLANLDNAVTVIYNILPLSRS